MSIIVPKNLPQHVALIPDGNRRWARAKGLPTLEGHRRGLNTVIDVAEKARNIGIKYFTVWFFSTENWKRSGEEVGYLMDLASSRIDSEKEKLIKDQVHFTHLGRKDRIPRSLANKFIDLEEETKAFTKSYFNFAFDYGGRDELLTAIKTIIANRLSEVEITEELVSSYLYTKGMPDPDLIIRTSGERRLSGYLPWQGVYSELYFATVHCPDFDFEQFKLSLNDYAGRERRLGGDKNPRPANG